MKFSDAISSIWPRCRSSSSPSSAAIVGVDLGEARGPQLVESAAARPCPRATTPLAPPCLGLPASRPTRSSAAAPGAAPSRRTTGSAPVKSITVEACRAARPRRPRRRRRAESRSGTSSSRRGSGRRRGSRSSRPPRRPRRRLARPAPGAPARARRSRPDAPRSARGSAGPGSGGRACTARGAAPRDRCAAPRSSGTLEEPSTVAATSAVGWIGSRPLSR